MICPICSNCDFQQFNVLLPRLINDWELANNEVDYINKQQGLCCSNCHSNLRSMTLADSMMHHFNFKGQFNQFSFSKYGQSLNLLEINEAGNLHAILSQFKNYRYGTYPEVDMQKMPFQNNSFDLIVHSDTLEHIENSLSALKECYRVLKDDGALFFTIPIVYSRMTKRRDFLINSYHGSQEETQGEDYKVYTEYGADFWVEIINAGFNRFYIHTIDDLSSMAICALKVRHGFYRKNTFLSSRILFNRMKRKINNILNT